MVLQKLPDENEFQYIWRIGQAKDNNEIDLSWSELADILNSELKEDETEYLNECSYRKSYATVKKYYEAGVFSNEKSNKNISENELNKTATININKDGTQTSNRLLYMTQEESKDPEFILKAHGFDSKVWKLVSARNTIRQAVTKDEGVQTLYASYITVKALDENEITLNHIEEFFNKLDRNYSLPTLSKKYEYLKGDKLLLIDIADLHLNLQSSMFTTNNEYNCDVAENLFFNVIEDILDRTELHQFEEIVFCIGGDMLNADNLSGTTTRGTMQTNDLHYYDAYERLCAMTIKAIDILKDLCKVNVIYVMGNHDETTGFKLAKYIDAWFRHDENVCVDYRPLARKYKVFGKTLLCFAHDGNVKKLPALIADEARQWWSAVDTVEVFLQHLHTEQILFEESNIRIQRLPTISAKSKWAADKGYNSKRQCKSFIFDLEDGLSDVIYTPVKLKGID